MVWHKTRNDTYDHALADTARGVNKLIYSNTTVAQNSPTSLTSFNSNGFSVNGSGGYINVNGKLEASWTFRKAPKFFDVLTWTGDGDQNRTIAHSLGVTPGMILCKRTDAASNWAGFHIAGNINSSILGLSINSTSAPAFTGINNSARFTSTAFKPYDLYDTSFNRSNEVGQTYVAYLFAHDTTADGVIQCGSFTGNGSTIGPTINLGWEPQFLLVKSTTETSANWLMFDNMRGLPVSGNGQQLIANSSGAEGSADRFSVTPTGFNPINGYSQSNASGQTYIYLAIRRGPMRVPTDATKVFNPQIYTGDYTTSTPITGMNAGTDVVWNASRTPASGYYILDRLRGWYYWIPSSVAAEGTTVTWSQQTQTSLLPSAAWWGSSRSQINYFFNRAPSFMDVVCYTGSGANKTQAHNLGVAPELMIVKRRNVGTASAVYSSSLANTEYLVINSTAAKTTGATYWNSTTPTSSAFSIGTSTSVNASGGTYVAYLFASCPGVSKVGSYTGTGATNQIDCGFTNGARFVLIKRTDSTGDWYVWDTARGVIAGNDPYLLLNSTAVEVTNTDYIDPLSTGFEISSTAPAAINANGGTFVFLAIA